jgi:hypothetical protein
MKEQGIDLVVHGFASDADAKRQHVFFEYPIKMGKFQSISHYEGLSTMDITKKIRALPELQHTTMTTEAKPLWFGAAVARATDNSVSIPNDPFPLSFRNVVEPHIRKATTRRDQAFDAILPVQKNWAGE